MYRSLFFRFVSKKTAAPEKKKTDEKEKEQDSPTHRLVSLLGMIGSRNLIVAIQVHRSKEGSFPVQPDGSVDLKASDLLKNAIEFEDSFSRNSLEYSETAYAAGVFFDLFLHLHAKSPDFKKLEPYFKEIIKRAQRTGVIAYLLASHVPGMSPKHALAAGMLSQSGKLMLAAAFPDGKEGYAEMERRFEKEARLSGQARALLERESFGVSHEEVSAHLLRYFDLFHSVIQPVRFFREPYCLKGVDDQNHKFAVLLGLADRMASTWKAPADEKDAVFADWNTPASPVLKLRKEKMIEAMKKAMNLK